MKYVTLLFFIYFIIFLPNAQAQKTSINGEVFTPRGELRALIIFAGYQGFDHNQDMENWPHRQEFPSYIVNGAYPEAFFADTAQFTNYPSDSNRSISRLFYEMSMGTFKFMADVYPRRINIDPSGNRGWGAMNRLVLQKLKETDPNFDWSPYDQRENRPNYLFDNSLTGPDGKPDYIIICHRYNRSWETQPVSGMDRWSGSGGGISVLQGVNNFKFNDQITIGSDGFHMNTVGVKAPESFRRLFKHELGHELLSCPHHFGTGGTLGEYFRSTGFGWGTAVSSGPSTRLMNSWERWMLGWTELTADLSDHRQNGIYELDDYATTGHAIRIKIPHTFSQYLWIENHQKKSIFDHSKWTGELMNQPPGTSGIADIDEGLYLYVEDLMDKRENVRSYMVSDMKKVNGTKFLNAGGNWDYAVPTEKTKSWAEYWNNTLYHFRRTEQNPYSGINPFLYYRFDANGNGVIENRHNFNSAQQTEGFPIMKEYVGDSLFLFYGLYGGLNQEAKRHRRVQCFRTGDTLSLSHNPPVVNNPRFDPKTNRPKPTYPNGIRIAVIGKEDGKYTLEIIFDNNQFHQNTRLAGILMLKPIPNQAIDYQVQSGVALTIDKSGTINSLQPLDGSFTHPSDVQIDSAVISFEDLSSLTVTDRSTFVVRNASQIILNGQSQVTISGSSLIRANSGASIILSKDCIISCDQTSTIRLEANSTVNGILLKKDFEFPKGDTCTGAQLLRRLKKLSK